jgi:protein transport protein SEC61 subunit gamma-like protein
MYAVRQVACRSLRAGSRCLTYDKWRARTCPFALAEFTKIALATSLGFAIMGFIGFFVKLIFIPINNIIVGMN